MRIATRDTRNAYKHIVTIEFTMDDLSPILGYDIDNQTDAGILKSIKQCFDHNAKAREIAVRNFHPAAIMADSLKKLNQWLEDASQVATTGIEIKGKDA